MSYRTTAASIRSITRREERRIGSTRSRGATTRRTTTDHGASPRRKRGIGFQNGFYAGLFHPAVILVFFFFFFRTTCHENTFPSVDCTCNVLLLDPLSKTTACDVIHRVVLCVAVFLSIQD